MDALIREKIASEGFALLPGYHPRLPSTDVAAMIGPVQKLAGFPEMQTLSPRELESAPPNTYSGNFGHQSFPLHSDLAHWAVPPRYLMLRCIEGAGDVATRLLDGRDVVSMIGATNLERALVQPRRPLGGKLPLLRLLDRCGGGTRLRWDSLFLTPASRSSIPTFDTMRGYAELTDPREIVLERSGDMLVIDNWRMLHGRSPIMGDAVGRKIERAYFDELT